MKKLLDTIEELLDQEFQTKDELVPAPIVAIYDLIKEKRMDDKIKVLVVVEGGIVQNVVSNSADIDVAIVDYDSPEEDDDDGEIEDSASVDISVHEVRKSPLYEHAFNEPLTEREEYVVNRLKENNF